MTRLLGTLALVSAGYCLLFALALAFAAWIHRND